MAIQEPASPLWTAVKAIYDPWPADDEAMAADLAGAWRTGGSVLAQGTQEATRAAEASLAAWPDAAGEQFHGQVRGFAAGTGRLEQNVTNRAAHAEYYGNELTSAKNAIVTTIAQNEKGYADAGLAGPAAQNTFASQVAANLQQMIAAKADALRAYPADSPPVSNVGGNQAPTIGRALTAREERIARQVFGESLDLSRVRLVEGGDLSAPPEPGERTYGNAVATPGVIDFPPGILTRQETDRKFREDVYQGWLVHELTHQWQYQHGATVVDTGISAAVGNYDYGNLQQKKDEGRGFLSFNYEQQGDILRDFYNRNRADPITDPNDPFRHYANYVRNVPPDERVITSIQAGPGIT
jgi:hypothetical protein